MTERDKEDKQEKWKIIERSEYITNDVIYNQIYDVQKKDYTFLGWNKELGSTVQTDTIHLGNQTIVKPIRDKLTEKKIIPLPTGIEDYVDISTLERDIDIYIRKWLDISDEHREKAIWYVELTWIMDILHTIPYLRPLGTQGTGKTRYLDIIGGICYKPIFYGGAVTSAPIFRLMDLWQGTMILDEFNLNNTDESTSIVQILNTGYERGKVIFRCDRNNDNKVDAFNPFGAKILGTKSRFRDKALESRCITEVMKETGNTKIPSTLSEEFYKERQVLQNKLLKFRFDNLNRFNPNVQIKVKDVMPRIKQTFNPFAVLFSDNPERLKKFEKYVKSYNDEIVQENAGTFDGLIVNAYLDLKGKDEFLKKDGIITSTNILDYLKTERLVKEDTKATIIGSRMKTLGFGSKVVKKSGKTKRRIIIEDSELEKLRRRYVPKDEKVTEVTTVTAVTE